MLIQMAILMLLITACTSKEKETEELPIETEIESLPEKVDEKQDIEVAVELEEEPIPDPYANLLETAPELPTNFSEVINHPVGPLAGNGRLKGKAPLMPLHQMTDFVKRSLPPIPEDADEIYLDKWFRAYRNLFAENYPDPNEIITKLKFNHLVILK